MSGYAVGSDMSAKKLAFLLWHPLFWDRTVIVSFSLSARAVPSFHPGAALIAGAMNGNPLDAHSDPLKLVATGDKRPARSVPNLTNIERKLFV
jgi:hypothetical protein